MSAFAEGDVVLTDAGRIGVYKYDGKGTYGNVLFIDGGEPNALAIPWSALTAPSGLWRCRCPRYWQVATSPHVRCDSCGFERIPPAGDEGGEA